MTLPSFVVVGAGRSGTTAIHRLLDAHPGVAMCPKSPNHFAAPDPPPEWEPPAARAMMRHWVADETEYRSLFDHARPGDVVGEVSPVYLQSVHVPARLARLVPDARIVAVLRDPAERALSHWSGRRRDGIDRRRTFTECVDEELTGPLPTEVAFGHYVGIGQYHRFLSGFLDTFGRERVHVVFHDQLLADPHATAAGILRHVGVEPSPDHLTVPPGRNNESGVIASPVRRAIWESTVRVRTALRPHLPARLRHAVGGAVLTDVRRPSLDPATRARIIAALRDDIEALQGTLGVDLGHWLS